MYTYNYTCLNKGLHLFKTYLCCFLDMHLYSNNLSKIAIISSLMKLTFFPACFLCSNSFNLLHISSGSDDRNIVFETPEAETIKPDDLSEFIKFYLE